MKYKREYCKEGLKKFCLENGLNEYQYIMGLSLKESTEFEIERIEIYTNEDDNLEIVCWLKNK